MCTTKHRIAVLVLAVLVLLAGANIENVSAENSSVVTTVNKSNIYTKSADTELSDMHFCTAKLLGTVNNTESQRAVTRCINKKRETKWSLDFLCSQSISFQKENYSVSSEPAEISYQGPEELVILYIHESDGKKRI